jgi:hypothetical protein
VEWGVFEEGKEMGGWKDEDRRISNPSARAKPGFLRCIVFIGEIINQWPVKIAPHSRARGGKGSQRLGISQCLSQPRRGDQSTTIPKKKLLK